MSARGGTIGVSETIGTVPGRPAGAGPPAIVVWAVNASPIGRRTTFGRVTPYLHAFPAERSRARCKASQYAFLFHTPSARVMLLLASEVPRR